MDFEKMIEVPQGPLPLVQQVIPLGNEFSSFAFKRKKEKTL